MISVIGIAIALAIAVFYLERHPMKDTEEYRMGFHKFLLYFLIPFFAGGHLADSVNEILEGSVVGFLFQFFSGILCILCFLRLKDLAKSAFLLTAIIFPIFYGTNFLSTLGLFLRGHRDFDIASVIASGVWFLFSVIVIIYYHRRRSLFGEKEFRKIVICEHCQREVPDDSAFCPYCGSKELSARMQER